MKERWLSYLVVFVLMSVYTTVIFTMALMLFNSGSWDLVKDHPLFTAGFVLVLGGFGTFLYSTDFQKKKDRVTATNDQTDPPSPPGEKVVRPKTPLETIERPKRSADENEALEEVIRDLKSPLNLKNPKEKTEQTPEEKKKC